MDFASFLPLIASLFSIILLDLVLSGDNAVIVGTIAQKLPDEQRKKAILIGGVLAAVFRILLTLIAGWLITIKGLHFIGGLTLLWVGYGMWNDLRDNGSVDGSSTEIKNRTFASALIAITVADLTMSVDNVLAVAGAANGHWGALMFGLILSIAMMLFCATMIAKLIDRYRWISWIGFIMVLGVAFKLMYEDLPFVTSFFH